MFTGARCRERPEFFDRCVAMMTRTLLARCATVAIAASAVLPAMPAFAQDATTPDPILVVPSEPAPAIPAGVPRIVLPEPVAEASAPANDIAPVAVASETARPVVAKPEVDTRPVPARRTAPPERVAASTNVPASRFDSTPAAIPLPLSSPTLAAQSRPVASPAVAARDNGTEEAVFAGIVGALGLAAVGGVALAATRRRRRRNRQEQDDVEIANESIAFEPAFVTAPERAPVEPAYAAPNAAGTEPALAATPTSGDRVALPAAMPETFEERDALLKDLVAADPDRANPFTSPRARARRAKLIMQSLGRSFRNRKPRIDLSEYSDRWPALRGWNPAVA